MNRKTRVGILSAIFAAAAIAGCVSPDSAYVEADRATFEAVAPYVLDRLGKDEELSKEQRRQRRATISSWEYRLDEALNKRNWVGRIGDSQ